jgi:hypothetical protein
MNPSTLHNLDPGPPLPRQSPINNAVDWVRELFTFLEIQENLGTPY